MLESMAHLNKWPSQELILSCSQELALFNYPNNSIKDIVEKPLGSQQPWKSNNDIDIIKKLYRFNTGDS